MGWEFRETHEHDLSDKEEGVHTHKGKQRSRRTYTDISIRHTLSTLEANLKSISQRCYLQEVAFEWELTKEIIYFP